MCSCRCSHLIVLGLVLAVFSLSSIASEEPSYWIAVMREGASQQRKEAREALIAMGTGAIPATITSRETKVDAMTKQWWVHPQRAVHPEQQHPERFHLADHRWHP